MIDLNKAIYQMLKGICKVELEFPTGESSFPLITITEIVNISDFIVEGKEYISDITYQVDVWDNGKSRQEVERIAGEVNDTLIRKRFDRILARSTKENGIHRKTMYFSTKALNK